VIPDLRLVDVREARHDELKLVADGIEDHRLVSAL
jgi:hypothetical protein